MRNFDQRQQAWDCQHKALCQGDSPKCPFIHYVEIFKEKNVLEIGAGEGRQARYVFPLIRSYTIADISRQALDSFYKLSVPKYWIKDYTEDLGEKFDIVHFWYVLHHVPKDEAKAFFGFIERHLTDNGKIMFNVPNSTLDDPNGTVYGDDGIKTFPWTMADVETLLSRHFRIITIDNSCVCSSMTFTIIAGRKNDAAIT